MKLLRIILIPCIILALSICYATSSHAAYISHVRNATDAPLVTCSYEYIGDYKITGYDPYCTHCVSKKVPDGITRSGQLAVPGETVGMYGDGTGFYIDGKHYEFGTRIYIAGLGEYTVNDTGVGPGVVDVACGSHEECYKVTGAYAVYIIGG